MTNKINLLKNGSTYCLERYTKTAIWCATVWQHLAKASKMDEQNNYGGKQRRRNRFSAFAQVRAYFLPFEFL